MKPHAFAYERGDDLHQVGTRLENPDIRVIAGGQSLGPMLNLRLAQPESLLDIASLPELKGYQQLEDGLMIGAATTHAEIEDGLLPDTCNGILPRIARGIAYRAVRSRGTIGGSLAHADPAADWATSLCALEAQVILQQHQGGRAQLRRLYLRDFLRGAFQTMLAPGELILAVFVPTVPPSARFGYFKMCRKTGELAHAIGAVYSVPATATKRVVFGALAGAPLTLEGDDALVPERWRQALAQRAPDTEPADLEIRIHVMQRALDRSNQQ
ncbi:FAD binding domain-containing protein [Marinobacter sp. M1N3S26]|uniref:FAD binding domain-containing protein n=1 Tax=unclassified Marinobacter TaxID=83889 RepID=UPI00387B6AE9